jgi:diguanylate cyclase (GGDEF)-like protein/PAS domain S-box-containing protein
MKARGNRLIMAFSIAQRVLTTIFDSDSARVRMVVLDALKSALQCTDAELVLFDDHARPHVAKWHSAINAAQRGEPWQGDHALALPLTGNDGVIGAMCVGGREFSGPDAEYFSAITEFVAPVLDTHRILTSRERVLDDMTVQLQQQTRILDQIEDSVITMDLLGYITGWNGGAERLFGYTAAEAVGQNVLFLYADEDDGEDSGTDPLLAGEKEMVVRRRKKSGDVFWAGVTLSVARDQSGNPTEFIGYVRDITDRLKKEESLRLYGRIFENSGEGILVTDEHESIVAVNRAFVDITGFNADEVMGQTPRIFQSGRHDKVFFSEMWREIRENGQWQGEIWDRHKNGGIFPKWATISTVRDEKGHVTHYFSTFSDISERVAAEERIRQLAFYDTLTGLPNRATLYNLLEQALASARRNSATGAIMFIDLDRFKYVNDTLGHGAGDELIRRVSARFKTCLRASDVIARLGGDEFVVALIDIAKPDDAAVVAQKIMAIFASPFLIDGHEISISASIGISVYPADGISVEDLIKNADVAMYRAKDQGRSSFLFYSSDMNVRSLERLEMESSLRRALVRKELLLHYQPQVDIATGKIVGAEVLLRWKHPDLGMVSPAQFIPMAEETGLIVPIGQWVMEQAVMQNKAWLDAGIAVVKLAVNLSAQQLRTNLVDEVSSLLVRYQLPNDLLELEITESMVMRNANEVIDMLRALDFLGVPMSLDDFGTGYSSLSYLKRFPIKKLKIDQSFVRSIPKDADDIAITRAIIALSKSLGLKVIAEGVETRDQLDFLRREGCDEIQGYLFSRPVPAEEFVEMLKGCKRLDD